VLVKEFLTEEMIQAGRELVKLMDKGLVPITAALWLCDAESNRWRFIIASSKVRTEGPRWLYRKILALMGNAQPDSGPLTLEDIRVREPREAPVSFMKKAVRIPKNSEGVRILRNAYDGHLVEDAFVYRMR
jgi:hypothetical protein